MAGRGGVPEPAAPCTPSPLGHLGDPTEGRESRLQMAPVLEAPSTSLKGFLASLGDCCLRATSSWSLLHLSPEPWPAGIPLWEGRGVSVWLEANFPYQAAGGGTLLPSHVLPLLWSGRDSAQLVDQGCGLSSDKDGLFYWQDLAWFVLVWPCIV